MNVSIRTRRKTLRVAVLVAVLGLLGAACDFDPLLYAHNKALSECYGFPATMAIGWDETDPIGDSGLTGGSYYEGTEGKDIVVITNGPVRFNGLGGDDLICVNDTGMASFPYRWTTIDAGDGNDVVFNFSGRATSARSVPNLVVLGPGDDTYIGPVAAALVFGNEGADTMYTGSSRDWIGDVGAAEGDRADCGSNVDTYQTGVSGDPAFTNCETWRSS